MFLNYIHCSLFHCDNADLLPSLPSIVIQLVISRRNSSLIYIPFKLSHLYKCNCGLIEPHEDTGYSGCDLVGCRKILLLFFNWFSKVTRRNKVILPGLTIVRLHGPNLFTPVSK